MNDELLPNEETARNDSTDGTYEKHYQIKPGDTVLDLGAHVGYFTELAAQRVGLIGLVIAFEPQPRNFYRLLKRVKDLTQVVAINAAAYSATGVHDFFFCELNSGGHSLFWHENAVPAGEVLVVDIGRWLHALDVRPDFIKIDTESSEVAILESLFRGILTPPPAIAFEAHSSQMYWDCRTILEKNGYRVEPQEVHVGVCYGIPPE